MARAVLRYASPSQNSTFVSKKSERIFLLYVHESRQSLAKEEKERNVEVRPTISFTSCHADMRHP